MSWYKIPSNDLPELSVLKTVAPEFVQYKDPLNFIEEEIVLDKSVDGSHVLIELSDEQIERLPTTDKNKIKLLPKLTKQDRDDLLSEDEFNESKKFEAAQERILKKAYGKDFDRKPEDLDPDLLEQALIDEGMSPEDAKKEKDKHPPKVKRG